MRVEVVVPWRAGCAWRERAWDWARSRYRLPVTVTEPPQGGWCKAAAVMPAIWRSCADIVIVADADVWTDGIDAAVEAVHEGARWAVPHRPVRRLSEASTAAVLGGHPLNHDLSLEQRAYIGVETGGVLVAQREVLLDVPMDHRFVGWGQEDESWSLALRELVGAPWRGRADLWHMWHPPQPRETRRRGSTAGWDLHRRYHRAAGRPNVMRDLIEEVKAHGRVRQAAR